MSGHVLWTADAMVAAMRARSAGALPAGVPGLSIDSRTIAAGDAFFALRDVRDGHDFVAAAFKAGAGLAVVAADKAGDMPAGAPLLVVPDVLEALRSLARAARSRSEDAGDGDGAHAEGRDGPLGHAANINNVVHRWPEVRVRRQLSLMV